MKIRWAFLALFFLSGCAAVPSTPDVMGNLVEANPVPLAAVKLRSDAPLLGMQPVKGELGPGAPAVKLAQGSSYYRLYRLPQVNGTLHLKLISYCACLGFDKRIAVPVVRVLTKAGQVIEPLPDGYEYSVESAHGFTPLSVTLDVTVPSPNATYALVASDNSRPDASVERINIVGIGGSLMRLNVRAYPAGHFDIRYAGP
ncbi:MalM family protein [Rhodanobacter spathiphylli]|uniref:MalM family protein n=1 Tax=Rhodanobacter spathiphylli TaxID=347483 RepID=UPI000A05515A|nr:MalM family protein [Rhodanobacter spathiphylli]